MNEPWKYNEHDDDDGDDDDDHDDDDDDDGHDVLVLGVHMYAVIDVYLISKLPSGVNIIVI